MYVSYDTGLGYPQPAQFGRGIVHADGTYTPPAGLAFFEATDLVHGTDERLYDVTAVDALTAKSQADADAILDAESLANAVALKYAEADAYTQGLIDSAYANPVQGLTVDNALYERAVNARRKDKADKLAGAITLDQAEKDEAKTDQKLSEYENKCLAANDKARTEVDKKSTAAEVLALDIPTITTWPVWAPPV